MVRNEKVMRGRVKDIPDFLSTEIRYLETKERRVEMVDVDMDIRLLGEMKIQLVFNLDVRREEG